MKNAERSFVATILNENNNTLLIEAPVGEIGFEPYPYKGYINKADIESMIEAK
jgi:hypothetical protein